MVLTNHDLTRLETMELYERPQRCVVKCAKPADPVCKEGEHIETRGCCAKNVCVPDPKPTKVYSSCGILPFLPGSMGGPKEASAAEVVDALKSIV